MDLRGSELVFQRYGRYVVNIFICFKKSIFIRRFFFVAPLFYLGKTSYAQLISNFKEKCFGKSFPLECSVSTATKVQYLKRNFQTIHTMLAVNTAVHSEGCVRDAIYIKEGCSH